MSGWNAYIATIDYRFPLTALADTTPRDSLILAWYAALGDRRFSAPLTVSPPRQRADGVAVFCARPRKKVLGFPCFCDQREQNMKIYVAFGTNQVQIGGGLTIMLSRSGAAVGGICQPFFSMDSNHWLCN